MNRKGLIKSVTELLRENNIKKPISIPKHVFHISDSDGNSKDFTVKRIEKTAIYTVEDVGAVIDACMCVIRETLKRGEPISVYGFGTLELRYRKPRTTKQFGSGEDITVKGRYVPKFSFGHDLRMSAKVYEMSLDDRLPEPELIDDGDD